MKKILYLIHKYPQVSETYMESELRALSRRFEIAIITNGDPDVAYEYHHTFTKITTIEGVVEEARRFKPDIVHSHYMNMVPLAFRVASSIDVPFTIRSHSFDVFPPASEQLPKYAKAINSNYCAGLIGFPPTIELFDQAGYDMNKVVSCYPTIEYDWFYDRSPNGNDIMNMGACFPKKNMEDFVRLAARMPDRNFNLYAMGFHKPNIKKLNRELGNHMNFRDPVEPGSMPAEYKKHQWLVYTGSVSTPIRIGWSMAVAEAQAAGVGVCLQNVHPGLKEYVGGAGYLFDTVEEVAEIISNPVPDEIREKGFIHARKSDVHSHINKLVNMWRQVY